MLIEIAVVVGHMLGYIVIQLQVGCSSGQLWDSKSSERSPMSGLNPKPVEGRHAKKIPPHSSLLASHPLNANLYS